MDIGMSLRPTPPGLRSRTTTRPPRTLAKKPVPVTPFAGGATVRPAFNTSAPWSPFRLFDNLPPLPTFEPFDKKPVSNTTAPRHIDKPPPMPTFEPFDKKPVSNTTAPRHIGKPPPMPTFEPFDKKPVSNTTAPRHIGKPPPMPTFEPFDKKPVSNKTAPRHIGKPPPMPTFEPFDKKPVSNTTAPRHVGKPPPIPTFEPFDKKPVSNTTAPRHIGKPLPMPTFKPFDHKPPPRFVLHHFRPFKPIDDWKHFWLPDFKSKLAARTPSPAPAASHTSARVTKAILCVSAFILAFMVIYFIVRKRIKQTRGDRGALNNNLPPRYYEYGSTLNLDVDDEPPPYTNPEGSELQDHKHGMDQCHTNVRNINGMSFIENEQSACGSELVFDNGRIVERLSLDLNSYEYNIDTEVASNDYVQDF